MKEIKNTYLMWDIKVINEPHAINGKLVRIMAATEEEALKKAALILSSRIYSVVAVVEYWMPGVNIQEMTSALERVWKEGKEK